MFSFSSLLTIFRTTLKRSHGRTSPCSARREGGFHCLRVRTHIVFKKRQRLLPVTLPDGSPSLEDISDVDCISLSLEKRAKMPPTPYQCGHGPGMCKQSGSSLSSNQPPGNSQGSSAGARGEGASRSGAPLSPRPVPELPHQE